MDFFKYFHFGLKRKYKYLLFGVVVFLLIFNLLSLFGYCSSTVESNVELSTLNDVGISGTGILARTNGNTLYYFYGIAGYTYTIYSPDGKGFAILMTSEEPRQGLQGTFLVTTVQGSSPYTFTASTTGYYYAFGRISWTSEPIVVVNSPQFGFGSSIFKLVSGLEPKNMWDTFSLTIPFISVVVVVCIGFYSICKIVDKIFVGK